MDPQPTPKAERSLKLERRVLRWTLLISLAAAVVTAILLSPRAGIGVWIGALLAWLNARWLQQAVAGLVRVATAQAGAEKPRISPLVYLKLFLRYALIAVILYVMVTRFNVPVLSMLAGLCSLGAAALAVVIYELVASPD